MSRWWVIAGVAMVVVVYKMNVPGALTDLSVYRSGGAAWLHGVPLYTKEFPSWLPYTYPPVSAVVFGLLAMMPAVAAAAVVTVAGLVALSATTTLAVRPGLASGPRIPAYGTAPTRTGGRWLACGQVAVVVALAVEPVRATLMFGQVNLVLMGLVALDCLLPRTRYPRGMLIGIAAAVKLTPAVFVLFFLVRRQYSAAVTAVVTFAAATGFGMLFAPADSVRYWHVTIFDADRIGGAAFATNQSLRGALSRFDLSPGLTQACWLVLVVAVLAVAWRGARRAAEPVDALLMVAAAGLLVSPVSWSHHWVWIVPALAVWVARSRINPAMVLVATVFVVGHTFLPHARNRELEWTWWQHLVGNSYLLAALVFLAVAAFTWPRDRTAEPVAVNLRSRAPTP